VERERTSVGLDVHAATTGRPPPVLLPAAAQPAAVLGQVKGTTALDLPLRSPATTG